MTDHPTPSDQPPRHHYEFGCGNCGEWITALIPCERAAPDAPSVALDPYPELWTWLYDDYDKGTVFITDDPKEGQRPLFAQSFDERTARLIVEAHNASLARLSSVRTDAGDE